MVTIETTTIISSKEKPFSDFSLIIFSFNLLTNFTIKNNVFIFIYKVNAIKTHLWKNKFQSKEINWKNVFLQKLVFVKEQKIIAFNFKFLHNILATPAQLYKCKIFESNVCHLCISYGNLEHMMIDCSYFENYYKNVHHVFCTMGLENLQLDLFTLVCGYKSEQHEYKNINKLVSLIFFVVYKCWMYLIHNGKHINPLTMLLQELNIRINTVTYCDTFFKRFFHVISAVSEL